MMHQVTPRRAAGHVAAGAAVSVVAVTAAIISFTHVRDLALASGETELNALLMPLAIDGAIAAGAAVVLADSRAGRRSTFLTWSLLVLGIAASLGANIASAEPTWTARALAAWPPLALALGIEVLASLARRSRTAATVSLPTIRPATGHQTADETAQAIETIRRLDAQAESGQAPRRAIQQELGCGASKATRLSKIARAA